MVPVFHVITESGTKFQVFQDLYPDDQDFFRYNETKFPSHLEGHFERDIMPAGEVQGFLVIPGREYMYPSGRLLIRFDGINEYNPLVTVDILKQFESTNKQAFKVKVSCWNQVFHIPGQPDRNADILLDIVPYTQDQHLISSIVPAAVGYLI